ncbi:transposase [Streptomyces sp. NPDC059909]|uniref:transposase n=1 Tax=Streptomyces sp. NPDC059909 TaxID=3346998 RepID=UPI00366847EB
MTDGQWGPLLAAAGSTGRRGSRPEKWDRRLVLDAIFYLVRGGIAWRALPTDVPRTRPSTPCSAGGPARGRGAGSTQRCVNVRVWPTGVAQCRPRP